MNTINPEIDEMRQLLATALKLGLWIDARYWHQKIKIAEADEREASS